MARDDVTLLPASVTVVFPRSDDGAPAATPHVETVTLTSLALPEFPGVTGYAGTKVFHTSAVAAYVASVITNGAEVTALARAAAADFYRFQAGKLDLVLVGYPTWTLTGLDDVLVCSHEAGNVSTRISRGAFNDSAEELHHYGSAGEAGTPVFGPVTYTSTVTFLGPVNFTNTVTYTGPVYLGPTTVYVTGPTTFSIPPGGTLYYGGGGTVQYSTPVVVAAAWCFEHYVCWDAYFLTITASQTHNLAGSTRPWWLLSSADDYILTGIVAPDGDCDGCEIVVTNDGPGTLVLTHDDANSAVGNRIKNPTLGLWGVPANYSVWLRYDRSDGAWRVITDHTESTLNAFNTCFTRYVCWESFTETPDDTNDDYPGDDAPWWLLAYPSDYTITGIVAPAGDCDGCEHVLTNDGPGTLRLTHDDGNSSPGNRILTPTEETWEVAAFYSVWIRYDRAEAAWRVITDHVCCGGAGDCYTAYDAPLNINQNDYDPDPATWLRLSRGSSPATVNLTGFAARGEGCALLLTHTGATGGGSTPSTFTVKHDSASSVAANRVLCPQDTDVVLESGETALFRYDATAVRWRLLEIVGTSTSGSVVVRKNSAGSDFTRRRLNLIEGTNVTLTVADDAGNDEVDVTIAASTAAGVPAWVKVTKTYSDLTDTDTLNDIEVYSLPAKGIVHEVFLKHSTAFTGGAIATYTLGVGPTGNPTKYISGQQVQVAPSDTNFKSTQRVTNNLVPDMPGFGAATSIRLQASTTGGNLNAATQGSVDVWLLVSTLP